MSLIFALIVRSVVGSVVAPTAFADRDFTGTVIVLDPGHGAATDGPLGRQVPNDRGGTKDCQTTGTATDGGFPEHTFNWDGTTLIRDQLDQLGATTVLTRTDDSGPAACVDARATPAKRQHPSAIIHGDGGPTSGHGFHVNYSSPPLNDAQSGPSVALATTMRDALVGSGLTESKYIGSGGYTGAPTSRASTSPCIRPS